ncbi:hypothetical protein E3E35_08775 [Thermococcus sp. GR7]|nr:hypothetical protein [Thermococcus sp. GR7]NJF23536.1 hypothetical protein [Thermococcus sp. GR5]
MGLTWTQLPEEIKYTAKQIGFYLIGIPFVVAVIYMFTSWTPLPSDAIVGTSSFPIAVLISLFLGGPVVREKLLGIHEVLLILPFDPVKFIFMRTLASFIIGIAGIVLGSVAGWFIALYVALQYH